MQTDVKLGVAIAAFIMQISAKRPARATVLEVVRLLVRFDHAAW